ncbi:MAG: hypothetical protein SX243_00595 [Acidobacteriota bacterium]|nr:hypothetical protein [Acidobacteriota bacterium]
MIRSLLRGLVWDHLDARMALGALIACFEEMLTRAFTTSADG